MIPEDREALENLGAILAKARKCDEAITAVGRLCRERDELCAELEAKQGNAAREALEQEADRFERALGTGEWSRADIVRALRERAGEYE